MDFERGAPPPPIKVDPVPEPLVVMATVGASAAWALARMLPVPGATRMTSAPEGFAPHSPGVLPVATWPFAAAMASRRVKKPVVGCRAVAQLVTTMGPATW